MQNLGPFTPTKGQKLYRTLHLYYLDMTASTEFLSRNYPYHMQWQCAKNLKSGPLVAVLINKICAAQVKVLMLIPLFS